ncbi:CpaD family pilus assembly lipoprotein [Kiloniella majae]|uniref:CpaD family pilus assembly lipoprotein n=1 Tax=Kiloniella majae TaxID=1938558 RepID=UPI000A27709C|nr:CpaD family pilus assembly lipoprotein [Kiloniella majae]
MKNILLNKAGFWIIASLSASTLTMACTSQKGFETIPPEKQVSQAVVDFMNIGRWRPISTSKRTRTYSYIATEGFYIPIDFVDSLTLEKEINEFISNYKVNTQDDIILDGIRNAAGNTTAESENAINRIQFSLKDLGYSSRVAKKPIAIFTQGTHNAAILIHRKVIATPECEIKKHPTGTRPPLRTFGCAQEVNLANMVVTPEALDGTLPTTSADSTAVALGVERYRRGEITPLLSSLSTGGL